MTSRVYDDGKQIRAGWQTRNFSPVESGTAPKGIPYDTFFELR